MRFATVVLLFISVSTFAHPLRLAPSFEWSLSDDATDITVGEASYSELVELPTGNYDLKTYRATAGEIDDYAKQYSVAEAQVKNGKEAPECTAAEIDALKKWVGNDYYAEVNRILREVKKGEVAGKRVTRDRELLILMIASAVNCAPPYRGPAVRMEKTPEPILAQYQPGRFLIMRGFTSATQGSTPSQWFLENFTQVIHYPEVRGADIHATKVSGWEGESEVLIRPGTVFYVVSRNDSPEPLYKIKNSFIFSQP